MLAPVCVACETPLARPTAGPVCATCWRATHRLRLPLCNGCGDELATWRITEEARCPACRARPSAVTLSRSAVDYAGPLRRIIHAFKYDRHRTLARPLGLLLRDATAEVLADAACTVPVPLHPLRRLQRGFNQAADLAQALPAPIVHALWRRIPTTPQEGLSAHDRAHNVRDAFTFSPLVSRRVRASCIEGQVVVLVDDVRTTGATLESCARTLLAAGALEVRAATVALARVHRERDGSAGEA